jgi:hypothetical protein
MLVSELLNSSPSYSLMAQCTLAPTHRTRESVLEVA